ncbi:hypothetical protein BD779DRAFT_1512224 [Infundibulicybe gibba]|nr:hypothetical protein BD779DRAFT_1512224 [Infundibulicybe gibba]
MGQKTWTILALLVALLAGFYQLYLNPLLIRFGKGRIIEALGNEHCTSVPELQACEKLVLHEPSGIIYLACSTPSSRVHWTPAVGKLNPAGASFDDYVATYDLQTSRVTRLQLHNFTSSRGLSLHGMDVVPSISNPEELWVYLVNHRKPLQVDSTILGADSAIEIFKTMVGSHVLEHIQTIEDPVINTPNDIVGFGDGSSFYFTNDHGSKTGLVRQLDLFGWASTSVGYCKLGHGCKYAVTGMHANNGIARAQNDTFYVANCVFGGISILERQGDDTLVITDTVKAGEYIFRQWLDIPHPCQCADRGFDNVMVDADGVVWAAGLSKAMTLLFKHFNNPSIPSPSSALRISINTGPASFYGEKYRVDKVFEDDGSLASGITSVVHDARRKRLFLHGLASPALVCCPSK